MATSRREHTSGLIRSAALTEFTTVGPRAFSLQDVARRAFVSVGAVYDRWPDKETCITDLIDAEFASACEQIVTAWGSPDASLPQLVTHQLLDEESLQRLRFIAECVFAARDDARLLPRVQQGITSISSAIQPRVPAESFVPAIGWWAASTMIGYGLLRTSGCPVPDTYTSEVVSILERIGPSAQLAADAGLAASSGLSLTALHRSEQSHDERSASLVDATLRIVEQGQIDDADARTIAGLAGLTTGALYRRFTAKAELLAAAFNSSLEADRYAWLEEFVLLAERGDFEGISTLLADRCTTIWTDRTSAHTLLEFTVAAHSDERVRLAIFGEMAAVAKHRESSFAELASVGVIRNTIAPADIAWCLQIPTVGMRILGAIDVTPSVEDLRHLLAAYLVYLITDVDAA